jgi:hypothetical protein
MAFASHETSLCLRRISCRAASSGHTLSLALPVDRSDAWPGKQNCQRSNRLDRSRKRTLLHFESTEISSSRRRVFANVNLEAPAIRRGQTLGTVQRLQGNVIQPDVTRLVVRYHSRPNSCTNVPQGAHPEPSTQSVEALGQIVSPTQFLLTLAARLNDRFREPQWNVVSGSSRPGSGMFT